ncbi:MAG: hypothetical protein EPN82_13070 [Bacteroidetes bacterium]|nr:MAG: hypothetical protein EPN82_13070 [Bacteroidota bacterium]
MNIQELNRLIEKFKEEQICCDKIIDYIKKQKDLKKVIELAALARDENGIKHNHQRLIPDFILNKFKKSILKDNIIEEIKNAKHFDKIYTIIEEHRIKGIRELTIYDIAHRIGIYINKFPDKIYLHRGARVGAEKLLGRKIKDKYILREILPESLKSGDLTCA